MKLVSRLALAAMLSLSATAMSATPALAQKKGKDAGGAPALQISDAFRKPAAAADAALKAGDLAALESNLAAADAVAKNDDEKYYAAYLRLQLSARKKDNAGVASALDVLLANPKTPKESLTQYNFVRGSLYMDAKQQAQAIPYLEKARDLGSTEHDLPLLLAQAYFAGNNTAQGIAELDRAIKAEQAAGRKAPDEWYAYGLGRLYKSGDRSATADWMMRELREYPSAANWRKLVILYRDSLNKQGQQLTKAQKIDLYRLQNAAGALVDQNDFQDYANAAQNSGLPWEAKKIVEQGRSSGKLPAGDSVSNQILTAANAAITSDQPLAVYEKKAQADATGKTASQTADAYLASGEYAKAITLYQMALTKGGVDADEVNTRLGIALAMSGQKPAAKEAFAKVTGAPRADIAKMWINWIDMAAA